MEIRENLISLFYSCYFKQVIRRVDRNLHRLNTQDKAFALSFRLHAASELDIPEEIEQTLSALESKYRSSEDFETRFYIARLHFFRRDFDSAHSGFERLLDCPISALAGKSRIGLANVLLQQHQPSKALETLSLLPEVESADITITAKLTLADIRLATGVSPSPDCLYEAYRLAFQHDWPLWQIKSQYSLMKYFDEMCNPNAFEATRRTLRAMLEASPQCRRLIQVLRTEYPQELNLSVSEVYLDNHRRSISHGSKTLNLAEKPQVFRLLKVLQSKKGCIPKDKLSAAIWPDEKYQREVHDPRIFNLVKRARNLMADNLETTLQLKASRSGYSLHCD